ncbi:Helicase associated domain protein [Streptomyces sp. NPDC093097]|uniref:DEAD/DEAH box helicase n=1 Tax=Streptomyces sp. NPDC093097 TaxID=3366027 RepID=UPI0037F2CC6A
MKEHRLYQREAVAAVAGGLAAGGTGQLHAACGTGKTFMCEQAAAALLSRGGVVAICVPSLLLVAQTLDHWRTAHGEQLDALAVCSDDTVADEVVDLAAVARVVKTTTQPEEIATWLGQCRAEELRLIVSTYLSAPRLAEAVRTVGHPLDFLILDEAHHLSGTPREETRQLVEDRAFLPSIRRLYTTATPRSGGGRAGALSMDDTAVFGPVLYSYPFAQAIAEGYLEDYRLMVIGVRDSECRTLLTDRQAEYVPGLGLPSLQTLAAQVALGRAFEHHHMRRVLTFHPRIEASRDFAHTLPATLRRHAHHVPCPYTGHVDGTMDHAQRERVLDGLRTLDGSPWAVVSNSRCLGEGVDVPAVDGVLFAHPKRSAVDVVQAVGRALRKHPDTPGHSTVIVPIVLPEEDEEIGDLDAGDYEVLWQVVRALRAHDEALGLALDHTPAGYQGQPADLPEKITVILPDGTTEKVLEQIKVMMVRQSRNPWWEGYAHARAFHAAHGHLKIPMNYVNEHGYRLWRWYQDCLKHRRRGWMGSDRIAALDDLQIIWDPHAASWAHHLEQARHFHACHGHLLIPQDHQTNDGIKLGRWLNRQRTAYKRNTLHPDRQAALEELGIVWDTRADNWQRTLAAARAYRDHHGHLDVPYEYVADNGVALGKALSNARTQLHRGTLTADRVETLTSLGMLWQPQRSRARDAFDAFHAACRRHLDTGGQELLALPNDYRMPDGYPLGARIAYYRNRKTALPPDQEQQFHALGLAALKPDAAWERNLAALTAFAQREGHLKVPNGHHENGVNLASLLSRLRTARTRGTLPTDRAQTLEDLGIDWNPSTTIWADFLAACRTYIAGNGPMPTTLPNGFTTPDGYALAQRLDYYRQRAGSGQLTPEQVQQMLDLGIRPSIPRRRTPASNSRSTARQ